MSSKALTSNTLFFGDNLDVLRQNLADESVDLIDLDSRGSTGSRKARVEEEHGQQGELL